jgi:hypothetical protein
MMQIYEFTIWFLGSFNLNQNRLAVANSSTSMKITVNSDRHFPFLFAVTFYVFVNITENTPETVDFHNLLFPPVDGTGLNLTEVLFLRRCTHSWLQLTTCFLATSSPSVVRTCRDKMISTAFYSTSVIPLIHARVE